MAFWIWGRWVGDEWPLMKTAFALYRYRMKATNNGLIHLVVLDMDLLELI